jgi:protein-disulfide reductase (glutathione)
MSVSILILFRAQDKEEPIDPEYSIDGTYIPRVFFLDSSGAVRHEISNPTHDDKYKYFYKSADELVAGMKAAVNLLDVQNAA